MPVYYENDRTGGVDLDTVSLRIGGHEFRAVQSYEITSSILEVPTSFAARVGHSGVLRDLVKACPPHAPYQLFIADQLHASGRLDGFSVPSDAGTTLELRGRDGLAPLHDAFVREEQTFENISYLEMVKAALKGAGTDPGKIHFSNAANRNAMSRSHGSPLEPRYVEEIITEKGAKGLVYKTVVAKMSERWLELVRQHLDRAGLFLWRTAAGEWVLGAPNPYQDPLYRLTLNPAVAADARGFRGGVRREEYHVGVEPPRYSEVIIYSRKTSKKYGRTKVTGVFVDEEMIALGIDRPLTLRDANVATQEQAERLAQRKLAEGRRATFRLRYTTHGHTARGLIMDDRCVWTPDTVVYLDDREIGLQGNFYIDNVVFSRSESNGTTTTLTLARPEDVLYGPADGDDGDLRTRDGRGVMRRGSLEVGAIEIVENEDAFVGPINPDADFVGPYDTFRPADQGPPVIQVPFDPYDPDVDIYGPRQN